MTPAGSAMAKNHGGGVEHSYMPYDYQFAVKRFLVEFNPKYLFDGQALAKSRERSGEKARSGDLH